MKLLFDQNLSQRLIIELADLFPDSSHVRHVGLRDAGDFEVWDYARHHDFIIVTKDSDFIDLSLLHGTPPQVIWIRIGNCNTRAVARVVRKNFDTIEQAVQAQTGGVIELY
jgi:predicted nuclease of predicted toxin-antitoxin system